MNKLFYSALVASFMTLGVCDARSQSVSDMPGGHPVVLHDSLHVTPAMVDSIRAVRHIENFEHDVESGVFVPKGQWVAGVSVSYTQSNQNKYQFFILEGISGEAYTMKISPTVLYIFKNDMGVGARFSYTRSLAKLEKADIVLGADTEMNIQDVYSLSHNYYGTALFRNYFSIGNSKRFGFFNEVQLQLGGGQSKITTGRGESLSGTYERNFSLDVGIVPGIAVFLNNYSAVEVNVGVLGFSYTHTKSIRDRIYVSHRRSQSANFRINLFSISFGAAFYI
ncbi:MAG: hypothetical protein K2M37_05695 [Muribaculaceae bacterium]|nr:hypothetical protein [Muribaculaceae bacterium]